jgi:hypothetical protein
MIGKNRDSKFIIYQVLYIFVITVLALKGADLDLRRVVREDTIVEKSVRDSLVTVIDSLYAQGFNFDIKIDQDIKAIENKELKEKIASLSSTVQTLTQKIKEIPPEERIPEKTPVPVKEQIFLQSPISLEQTFIQHTWNIATNTGSVPAFIHDPADMNQPLAVIKPGEEKKFDLGGQDEVIIKFGSQQQTIKVEKNLPPEVKIEKVTTRMSGKDVYVRDLQRTTSFTVRISDERPDQLKVTHSGPITVSGPVKDARGNLVYNVTLNLAPNQQRFDQWVESNRNLREPDGRYRANFFFIVVDEKSKDKVQVGDVFYFTDFSK